MYFNDTMSLFTMASSQVNANAALPGVLDDTTDVDSDISSDEEEDASDVEAVSLSDISFASSGDEESEPDEPVQESIK